MNPSPLTLHCKRCLESYKKRKTWDDRTRTGQHESSAFFQLLRTHFWTYVALSDWGSKSWTCRFMFLSGSDLSRITMLSVPERTPEGSFKFTWRTLAHAFYGPWGLIFSAMPPGPPSPAIQFLLMMTYACDKGHRHDFLLSLSNLVITFEWNRTAPLELWALHHSWNSFGDVQGWKLRKGHWGSRLARRHTALYTAKAGGKSGSQKWIVWCLPHRLESSGGSIHCPARCLW